MTDRRQLERWLSELRGAERELDEARRRTGVNYAARRLMEAKRELSWLEWTAALIYSKPAYTGTNK